MINSFPPLCSSCDSKGCFIRQFVSNEWKENIAAHKSVRFYAQGQKIFREGDPVLGIYFIYRGKVKVYNTGPEGRSQVVRLAGSGSVLGHRGFGENMLYPISATALEDSMICFIRQQDFLAALEHNPTFTINLMMFYAAELRGAEYKLRALSQMTVRQKLADALLSVRDTYGTRRFKDKKALAVQLTRQEYADIVGSSIEEVIRTFSYFRKEGFIEMDGRSIVIIDEEALTDLIAGYRKVLMST
jgi:CRP-like cAMP-binding protein